MEIADWLRGLSLERYAETFRDNAIDVAVLPDLSESDLEKLGVLLGHRKIMLSAIAALRGGAAENIAEPVPASATIPGRSSVAQNSADAVFCENVFRLEVASSVPLGRSSPSDLSSQAPYRKASHFKEVCRAAWRKDLGRE